MLTLLLVLTIIIIMYAVIKQNRHMYIAASSVTLVIIAISTETFYRTIFIDHLPLETKVDCTIIIPPISDHEYLYSLISYARSIIPGSVAVMVSDDSLNLKELIESFYQNKIEVEYISKSELSTSKFSNCLTVYDPREYCQVKGFKKRATILPRTSVKLLPNAEYLELNAKTIENCLAR